jgi:hypothetical protein
MAPNTFAIERALTFPMGAVIQRYAEEHDLPIDIAAEHAFELKRYLALCAAHPNEGFGMRGPIDEVWHTFILFTQDYAEFCNQVAGRFLHHEPAKKAPSGSENNHQEGPSIRDGYLKFLEEYERTFGDVPPRHLWPRPMKFEAVGTEFDGCGCGTCFCSAGGCSCQIAIADVPVPPPPPDIPGRDLPPGRPAD